MTGIIAVIGLSLLVIDQLGLEPLLNYRVRIKTEQAKVDKQLVAARKLIKEQPSIAKAWRDRQNSGLKDSSSEAESQVQDALARWGTETGLTLTASRQDRPVTDKDKTFQEIVVRASANGSMAALTQMLWRIETTRLPLRINALSITPRQEATDDLAVQLTLSTICQAPAPESDGRAPAGRGGNP